MFLIYLSCSSIIMINSFVESGENLLPNFFNRFQIGSFKRDTKCFFRNIPNMTHHMDHRPAARNCILFTMLLKRTEQRNWIVSLARLNSYWGNINSLHTLTNRGLDMVFFLIQLRWHIPCLCECQAREAFEKFQITPYQYLLIPMHQMPVLFLIHLKWHLNWFMCACFLTAIRITVTGLTMDKCFYSLCIQYLFWQLIYSCSRNPPLLIHLITPMSHS